MKMERVLLVEDDAVFRERLMNAFKRRQLTVFEADNLSAAKSIAARESLDGAVIDMRMPGGSGLEVVRELHVAQPLARLIILTGYGSIATATEAIRLGAADYMTKPADADQVLAMLRGRPATAESRSDAQAQIPSLDRVEWEHIQRVLADSGGNISQTARVLGLDRRSLQRKLAKFPPSR